METDKDYVNPCNITYVLTKVFSVHHTDPHHFQANDLLKPKKKTVVNVVQIELIYV